MCRLFLNVSLSGEGASLTAAGSGRRFHSAVVFGRSKSVFVAILVCGYSDHGGTIYCYLHALMKDIDFVERVCTSVILFGI